MGDLTTPYIAWVKPTVGADDGTWGGILNANADALDTFLRALVPAGEVKPYAGASAPTGFLLCTGQAVSRTTYATLFAAIGTTYGAGDGSTTFNVPDARDRVIVGAGSTYAVGVTGGALTATPTITVAGHALATNELPVHNHPANDPSHSHTVNDPTHHHSYNADLNGSYDGSHTDLQPGVGGSNTVYSTGASATGLTVNAATTGITVGNTGAGDTHTHGASSSAISTLPPFVAMNYIIKT